MQDKDKCDPVQRKSTCFVFPMCQAERDDQGSLVVTVPAAGLTWRGAQVVLKDEGISWSPSKRLASEVEVRCVSGRPTRHDRIRYRRQLNYAKGGVPSLSIRFNGPVTYGRIPVVGGWALAVHASVAQGGPADDDWSQYDAVEFSCKQPPPAKRAASGTLARTNAKLAMLAVPADPPPPPPPPIPDDVDTTYTPTGPHDPFP
ncbi:MAG TPA: hypothetical protein VIZ58_04200 [Thermoanaerobaculia bacterium]